MKTKLLALALCLFTGSVLAEQAVPLPEGTLKLKNAVIYGRVNTSGGIEDLSCGPTVAETLCKPISAIVATWRFQPGSRAGQPAAMDVNLNLGLIAVPKPPGHAVQVTAVLLSAKQDESQGKKPLYTPPVYPVEDLKHNNGGIVDIEVLLQPPSDKPRVGRLWFNGAEATGRERMVKAAVAAVQRWTLPALPPEQLTVCIPIEFSVSSGPPAGPERKSPCTPSFAEGFALPVLLTQVGVTQ